MMPKNCGSHIHRGWKYNAFIKQNKKEKQQVVTCRLKAFHGIVALKSVAKVIGKPLRWSSSCVSGNLDCFPRTFEAEMSGCF